MDAVTDLAIRRVVGGRTGGAGTKPERPGPDGPAPSADIVRDQISRTTVRNEERRVSPASLDGARGMRVPVGVATFRRSPDPETMSSDAL